MEDSEYTKAYENLSQTEEYQKYTNSIDNVEKYFESDVLKPLKMMVVNASNNQGAFKAKILALLDKRLQQVSEEIDNLRRNVGSIYTINEDAEYGGKKRRGKKTARRRRKANNRSRKH